MSRRSSSFRMVALAGDLAIAVGVLYAAFFLRTHVAIPGTLRLLPGENVRFTFWNIVIVAVVQAVSLSFFGLYRDHERFREPLGRLLLPALFIELATLASVYFLAQPYSFPRSVLVIYLVGNGLALAVWRAALDRIYPQPRRRALIVGGGPAAALIADTIRRHSWTGVELVGIVGQGDEGPADLPALGPVENLLAIVEARAVDEVILTPEASWWRDEIAERIPPGWRADLLVWPSPFETMIGRLRFRIVGDLPLLEARVRPLDGAAGALKRGFDAAVSAAALVLLAPGLGLAAALVAGTSRGGVFYRQTRVGRDGRHFELWKLRTMREGAEVETGAVLATADDPRITAIGRALRGARIDEIPQLWNVLRGDMSLVGPRPERPEFSSRFAETVPGYGLRHAARPGLTGLAQISGEYTTEPDIKLRYDLAYLNNWSFFLDLAILLRTLPVVLTRRGI
ncbi:MAG TPA: sugar transferase [Thermoanaerobaculia bacterium]|jgi:exopolysaccharide biosynthesis polyprenyl glycosylphosphotransferase|nr:sugar transferase [Thermoanaerobaculia bacterium]